MPKPITGYEKTDIQKHFVFCDTETQRTVDNEDKQEQELLLGYAIYWNRVKNKTNKCYFEEPKIFWEYIDSLVINKSSDIYLYAHNMDFDFKVLKSLSHLERLEYELSFLAPTSQAFILIFEKEEQENNLVVLSSTNYFKQPLKQIGKSLGYEKMDVDVFHANKNRIKKYCLRDTEILYKIMKKFVKNLEDNRLGKLGYTAPSTAYNVYRKSFYDNGHFDNKDRKIYQHDNSLIHDLELKSYRGGLCDVFKYGKIDGKVYKLDINSMYPFIYSNVFLPYKLSSYKESKTTTQKQLFNLLNENLNKEDRDVIAETKIVMPKEHSYLLKKVDRKQHPKSETTKAIRLSGRYNIILTSPEIEFVKKFGEIEEIKRIATYESKDLLSNYCSFFYNQRLKAKKNENDVEEQLNKLMLNSLYGKFGQQKKTTKEIKEKESKEVIENIYNNCKCEDEVNEYDNFSILEDQKNYHFLKLGDRFFLEEKEHKRGKNSFIPIASLITSYARIYLVDLFYLVGRRNVFYCDTDSLFVDQEGYNNLRDGGLGVRDKLPVSDLIPEQLLDTGEKKLGKLELEGIAENASFYRPKFYDFDGERKCKGIKIGKDSTELLEETEERAKYKQYQFKRFKTSLKDNEMDKQVINKKLIKEMNKKYQDGWIKEDNWIEPFDSCDLI